MSEGTIFENRPQPPSQTDPETRIQLMDGSYIAAPGKPGQDDYTLAEEMFDGRANTVAYAIYLARYWYEKAHAVPYSEIASSVDQNAKGEWTGKASVRMAGHGPQVEKLQKEAFARVNESVALTVAERNRQR